MCNTPEINYIKSKKENKYRRQQIQNLFYLLKERKKANDAIEKRKEPGSEEMIKWEEKKRKLNKQKILLKEIAENENEYKHASRNILRRTSQFRYQRIDKRFKENVERYVISLEFEAARDKDCVRNLELKISYWNERIEQLMKEICTYTRDNFLGSTEWKRENASAQITKRESEVEKIQKSIEKSKEDLLTLKLKASISHEKAKLLRQEMGYTVESFISYLKRLKERMEKQFKCEDLDELISNHLKDFENTVQFIGIMEGLSKDIESNLQEICDAVTASSRPRIHVSFDMCTQHIYLLLNEKTYYDLTLEEYITYLKDETIPRDINNIEDCLKQLTESIESLRAFVPDFKNLTNKIAHFQEILAEKKRMFKCLRK